MQYYLLSLITIPFLYLNFKIILTDLKIKKIPNKYLIYLIYIIPFYYIYCIFYIENINIIIFILQFILTLLISFILYYIWIWSAWDAKYLLTLSLFIPYIWIITFIGNIALLTIIYLLIYFIWFYFWRCLFNWNYTKSLYNKIYIDLKDKFINYIKNNDWTIVKKITIYKIIKWFVLFLILFVSFRLIRIYIIHHIILNDWSDKLWWIWRYYINILLENNSYYILLITLILMWLIYIIYLWIIYWKNYLINRVNLNKNKKINPLIIDIILISILWLSLISYILIEFFNNPEEITTNLKLIFTIYLMIYIMMRILKYSYHVTFQIWEQDYIDVNKLSTWDIIDKDYLIKLFWEQSILWYCDNNTDSETRKNREKFLLYPNPKKYFLELKWSISEEDKNIIKNVYKIVNEFHIENKTNNFQEIKSIKILKTFTFWIYIFIWFILTYLLNDNIYELMIKSLINYLKLN